MLKMLVARNFLVAEVSVVSLGIEHQLLYHNVSGLIYFVFWVTCCVWRTLDYRTLTCFPFSPWSGGSHLEAADDMTARNGKISSRRNLSGCLMSPWLVSKDLSTRWLNTLKDIWQRIVDSGDCFIVFRRIRVIKKALYYSIPRVSYFAIPFFFHL